MKVPDLKTAIQIYYQYPSGLGTKQISQLFGVSPSTAFNMKKQVQKIMRERNIKCWKSSDIHTQTAYELWGIDINDIERKYQKLLSLGLISDNTNNI
ncbi:MAG TPA: hypothetical protein H9675_04940 [Firmicutes bacterium]|nr:hypothetical protein [Bacillota bacterium]